MKAVDARSVAGWGLHAARKKTIKSNGRSLVDRFIVPDISFSVMLIKIKKEDLRSTVYELRIVYSPASGGVGWLYGLRPGV